MKKIKTASIRKKAQDMNTVAEVVAFYLPDLQEMLQIPYTKEDAVEIAQELLDRLSWLQE